MDVIKNLLVGLLVLAGLVIGVGVIIWGGSLIIDQIIDLFGLIAFAIFLIVTYGPAVLGVALVIFLIISVIYAIGKAIRERGK